MLLAVAATAGALVASASGAPVATRVVTTVLTRHVPHRGLYAIVVTLPAPVAAETASVIVGSQAQRDVALSPGASTALAFELHLPRSRFTVRTISSATAIRVKVADARVHSVTRTPKLSVTAPNTRSPAGSTGAEGATGAAGAPAPAIVGPPSGPYRHLVWAEEFNGPAGARPNPANWGEDSYGSCGPGTLSTSTLSAANASLDGDGHLSLTADGPPSYASAQLDSADRFSFEYGELVARIRLPAGSGLCSGFWMTGDGASNCWPGCGEIDAMEAISPQPDDIFGTLHGPVQGSTNYQQWQSHLTFAKALTTSFHTYGVIWRPGNISWTFDGVPYATATPASLPASAQWVFSGHSFHVMLSLAVGGWPGAPGSGSRFPATMSVDWVRLYN